MVQLVQPFAALVVARVFPSGLKQSRQTIPLLMWQDQPIPEKIKQMSIFPDESELGN